MNPSIRVASSLLLACTAVQAQSAFRVTRFADLPGNLAPAMFTNGDIDGDGDLDLLVANDYAPVQVLLNDGNGSFVDATAGRFASPIGLDNHAIDLVDIDGDGDLDALLGNEDLVTNYVFTNDGTGVFTIDPTALPPQANDTRNQVIADFDGDGDPDWLAVDGTGCRFYENNGGVFSDQTAAHLLAVPANLGYAGIKAPPARDFDGNGELDVLLPGNGGLLLNTGGVLTPAAFQLPITIWSSCWLHDVDGDGDIDIFAQRGQLLFANQGNATFVDVTATALPAGSPPGHGCFDVDGDGDIDIVRLSSIDVNDGSGNFVSMPTSVPLLYSVQLGHLGADYDGDSDLELPGVSNLLHHVDALTPPQIGSPYSVELHVRPGTTAPGLIVAALNSGTLPAGTFGTLRLDPATAVIVAFDLMVVSPLTVTWNLPNVAAFTGIDLHYQGMHIDPLAGVVLTNTFRDTVL